MRTKRSNSNAFHAPLHSKDTAEKTYGCRHTNPDNCSKNSLEQVCAFVRRDNICQSPSKSWPKQFKRLLDKQKK